MSVVSTDAQTAVIPPENQSSDNKASSPTQPDTVSFIPGTIFEGRITVITGYGAFVALPGGKSGMIHISEISEGFVRDIHDFLKEGQVLRVKVIATDEKGRISLSVKGIPDTYGNNTSENSGAAINTAAHNAPVQFDQHASRRTNTENDSFEDMMKRFKNESEEKLSDLKKSLEVRRSSQTHSRKNRS